MKSVLQDWVMELPLRVQGTLLTGIRGCDVAPKPYSHKKEPVERALVAFLRFCTMHPADPREVDVPGAFFKSCLPEKFKSSQLGHYPAHFVSHLMHAFEVVAYCCPDARLNGLARIVYMQMVTGQHLYPETKEQMLARLTEDRFVAGTVVS